MRVRRLGLNRFHAFIAKLSTLLMSVILLGGCGAGDLAPASSTSSTRASNTAIGSTSSSAPTEIASVTIPSPPPAVDVPRTASGLQKVIITLRPPAGKDAAAGQAAEAFKTTEALKATAGSIVQKGGSVKHELPFVGALVAEVPDAGVEALRSDPRVACVEPDLPVQCLGTELDSCWGVARVGAPAVWDQGNRGAGVRVAIIDTGVDYTHPDLRDAYAGGHDFFSGDDNPMDEFWHGTHVAGIVAARANDTGAVGVAPECRLYALKVCGANGGGSWGAIMAALQWCVQNRIQVANVSLGGGYPGQAVENAFAAARAAGVLIVAAAGNSGSADGSGNTVTYPGAFESCICVAATDGSNTRVGFSGTGPRVDVSAPGAGIYSCLPQGGYGYLSGTSMASPQVTGVVALALARGYSPAAVRTRLLFTALDLGASGRDPLHGAGLASIDRLVSDIDSPPAVTITSPSSGASLQYNKAVSLSAAAEDVEDGDVTPRIVWTVAGQTYAGPSVALNLPNGVYTATAAAVDSLGQTGSSSVQFTVRNSAPEITITSPSAGASLPRGKTVSFSAQANDAEDGNITSRIAWKVAGQSYARPSVSLKLPDGDYTATATVADSLGKSTSSSVRFTVRNQAPVVAITSPANGTSCRRGSFVTLTARATDAEDGDVSHRVVWSSNGRTVGRGARVLFFAAAVGSTTITAQITDSAGLASATVSVGLDVKR